MDTASLLMVAMAEKCKRVIQGWDQACPGPTKPLQVNHLLWMCDEIAKHAERGPATKLHRWIGFVQAGMLANQMLDLNGLKAMFDQVKAADAERRENLEDLLDHLDPTSPFEFDIGGQG